MKITLHNKQLYQGNSEPQPFRLGMAILVAPIVPALYLAIGSPIVTGLPAISGVGLLPIGYFFGLLFETVLGVPVYLLGQHLALVRWWSAVIVGTVVGLVAAIAIELPRFHWPIIDLYTRSGDLTFAFVGALTGFVFWIAGVLRRPEGNRANS